jgi:cyclopropane fatty-acyl-phospholipid synthase-like methyltransferase
LGYFDDEKNVKDYIKMAEGYDGRNLIEVLKKYLKEGSSILELGMGPGVDLDILAEYYKVTGSDLSQVFIDMYRKEHPDADLLVLDAVKMDTHRRFDSIYSNKVLHHLSREELKISFKNQYHVLNKGGLLFHTFWIGDHEETMKGLRFVYYDPKALMEAVVGDYHLIEMSSYTEMEDNDSFYLVLRKK